MWSEIIRCIILGEWWVSDRLRIYLSKRNFYLLISSHPYPSSYVLINQYFLIRYFICLCIIYLYFSALHYFSFTVLLFRIPSSLFLFVYLIDYSYFSLFLCSFVLSCFHLPTSVLSFICFWKFIHFSGIMTYIILLIYWLIFPKLFFTLPSMFVIIFNHFFLVTLINQYVLFFCLLLPYLSIYTFHFHL